MDKAKGVGLRVGGGDGWDRGEWWGKNGDNCTWTTIKKKKHWKKIKIKYILLC